MGLERLFFTGNQKFFVVFDNLAVQIRKMGTLLHVSVVEGDSHIWLHVRKMGELEQRTATQIHDLFMELGRNLITPFDREDIHFLATDLSNIARNVLHVTKQIRNYSIDCAGGVTEIVVKQISEALAMLGQILNKLKDIKSLAQQADSCSNIRRIIYTCDDLLDNSIATLLEEEKNDIQLIKMIDHYEALQRLLGKIGDTINVFEAIIIKYA